MSKSIYQIAIFSRFHLLIFMIQVIHVSEERKLQDISFGLGKVINLKRLLANLSFKTQVRCAGSSPQMVSGSLFDVILTFLS